MLKNETEDEKKARQAIRQKTKNKLSELHKSRQATAPQAQANLKEETEGVQRTANFTNLQERLNEQLKLGAETAVTPPPPPTETTTTRQKALPQGIQLKELQAGARNLRHTAATKPTAGDAAVPQDAVHELSQEKLQATIMPRGTALESEAQSMSTQSPSFLSSILSFITTPFTKLFNLFSWPWSTKKAGTIAAKVKPQLKPKPKPKNIEDKTSIGAPITSQAKLQNLKTDLRSIPQKNPSEKNLEPKEPSQLEEMLAKQRQKIGEL